MTDSNLNSRAQQLLKVLVERYIRDGQPVGSKTLAEDSPLALSSATIRNVMSDLEDKGYLTSPHTSAGRIPTDQGYRLFVDSLLQVDPLQNPEVAEVARSLDPRAGTGAILAQASNLLSGVTQLAGLVTVPKRDRSLLKHIEFLPLSQNRVLVVLVINDQEVQNRIIYTDREYSRSELQQASNYLQATYVGHDIEEIRRLLHHSMQQDRAKMDSVMQSALAMADQVLETPDGKDDYVIAGQSNLFDLADIAGVDKLRDLFHAFNEKQHVLHLLDKCIATDEVQIFIGQEAGYEIFDSCSLVGKPYRVDGEVVGVLGVIGPTRMPYDKVISVVDVTSKLLSAALGADKDS